MTRKTPNASVLRYAAFTSRGHGGNPAGVVLDAGLLDAAARQAIAADVNYSETAFIEDVTPRDHGDLAGPDAHEYRVRYFSPVAEVPFCGHATIAAAVALAERGHEGTLVFHTLAGPVPVTTERGPDGVAATLISPPTSTRPARREELLAVLRAVRWREGDLDPRYPAHVSFAGNHHFVLATASRQRLADLDYDYPALARLMEQHAWTTLHLVFAERSDLFHARDPFPPGGVVEDPATGSAAAAFGGYLRTLGLIDVPGRITILQGEDMGRPSELVVQVRSDERVAVSGVASEIADEHR